MQFAPTFKIKYKSMLSNFCRAKAKDRNFDFGRKLVNYIFGTFKTSFIMWISIFSQFRCFSEKIMGVLYGVLPLFYCPLKSATF